VEESFDDVIKEHLELQRRNSRLEQKMPLSDYIGQGPVFDGELGEQGAAFDTAEWQGRRRRVRDRDRDKAETFLESLEDVWSSGPVFDWGDRR
jgi:hypothetical protein